MCWLLWHELALRYLGCPINSLSVYLQALSIFSLFLSLFSQTERSSHGPSLPDWLFARNKGMGFGNWVALILIRETLNKIYLEIALTGSPPFPGVEGLSWLIHFPHPPTRTHTSQKLMLFNLVIVFVSSDLKHMNRAQSDSYGGCCPDRVFGLPIILHWHRWLNSKWISFNSKSVANHLFQSSSQTQSDLKCVSFLSLEWQNTPKH